MKRQDRELTKQEEFQYILEHSDVVHIGMHDGEDIYVIPMNYGFVYEEGKITLYVHGNLEGKKWDLIKKNGRVAIEIDCDHSLITGNVACQYGYTYASIMGNGYAEYIEDPQEKAEALSLLMRNLTGKDFEFTEKLAGIVGIAKITLDSYTGKRRQADV